ncbi:MAG: uracil-DNA glycosylase family protein [Burkholderiales bacterium]|nr:uracil-DNA glycosylase family protein [Burkholderiales bacterium]
MAVNWSAYTEEQLHELELLPLARWSGGVPEADAAPAPAAPKGSTQLESARQRIEVAAPPVVRREVPPPRPTAPASRPPATPQVVAPAAPLVRRAPAPGLGQADWTSLRAQVAACTACGLCQQRTQTVFGTGAESGPWMFVGEGPGMEEDQQGEPFVGQAGKLLDAMLASIQLSRETNVYIANVVKCRPPGNRTPTPDEANACADYLDRQIDLVSPKLIIALGKTAATRLTGQEASLASQRGKDFSYRGYPVLVTYHPAYLLRNLPDKAKAWEDLLRARRLFAAKG